MVILNKIKLKKDYILPTYNGKGYSLLFKNTGKEGQQGNTEPKQG